MEVDIRLFFDGQRKPLALPLSPLSPSALPPPVAPTEVGMEDDEDDIRTKTHFVRRSVRYRPDWPSSLSSSSSSQDANGPTVTRRRIRRKRKRTQQQPLATQEGEAIQQKQKRIRIAKPPTLEMTMTMNDAKLDAEGDQARELLLLSTLSESWQNTEEGEEEEEDMAHFVRRSIRRSKTVARYTGANIHDDDDEELDADALEDEDEEGSVTEEERERRDNTVHIGQPTTGRWRKRGRGRPPLRMVRLAETRCSDVSESSDSDFDMPLSERMKRQYDFFSCDECGIPLPIVRYNCSYCKSDKDIYYSYDLCTACFQLQFPSHHPHPPNSFCRIVVDESNFSLPPDAHEKNKDVRLHQDHFATKENVSKFKSFKGNVCALCRQPERCEFPFPVPESCQGFLAEMPLILQTKVPRSAWVHKGCALASPEVYCINGVWYNVGKAVLRGRLIKCAHCGQRGATIGCVEIKCNRSFHLHCCGLPLKSFTEGVVFWCNLHRKAGMDVDYQYVLTCDQCEKVWKTFDEAQPTEQWFHCSECRTFWDGYDLCGGCFMAAEDSGRVYEHHHPRESFATTTIEDGNLISDDYLDVSSEYLTQDVKNDIEQAISRARRKKSHWKKRKADTSGPVCAYCWASESSSWRRGYNGILMCEQCSNDSALPTSSYCNWFSGAEEESGAPQSQYVAAIEDYDHQPYWTRSSIALSHFAASFESLLLESYGPSPAQAWSLKIRSSFFDISGRAPRWASHSGSDYRGTWLPHIARWSLRRFTKPGERVLSNFLGRGTDVIECFLLGRISVGVDVNPLSVALSQKNCSFSIPPGLQPFIKAHCRPTLVQGDSTNLKGALFQDESFDLVLSHPPYHRCIVYSSYLASDLSRISELSDFCDKMKLVAQETWRMLKPGARCIVGLGDNREHCFVVPVGFATIHQYLLAGFYVEEVIGRRQRYCAGTPKGATLAIIHDFLILTHEYIYVLRKPAATERQMCTDLWTEAKRKEEDESDDSECRCGPLPYEMKVRRAPNNLSFLGLLGTTWDLPPDASMSYHEQCLARIVRRFGAKNEPWAQLLWLEDCQLEIPLPEEKSSPSSVQGDAAADSVLDEAETNVEQLTEYELERLSRVHENNRMLHSLGLIVTAAASESAFFSSSSSSSVGVVANDVGPSLSEIMNAAAVDEKTLGNAGLGLVVVPPVDITRMSADDVAAQLSRYLRSLRQVAQFASKNVLPGGYLAVGVCDVRLGDEVVHLPLYVWQFLLSLLSATEFPLKEIIVVAPRGWRTEKPPPPPPTTGARNGSDSTAGKDAIDEGEYPADSFGHDSSPSAEQHLRLVHHYYLLFRRTSADPAVAL